MNALSPDIDATVSPGQWMRDNFPTSTRFAYCPNSGNLGDVLIAAGTVIELQKSGLNWSFYDHHSDQKDVDVFVYGGGGNLVPMYKSAMYFLENVSRFGKPIVILPHTVRGHESLLAGLKNTMIFCRDRSSLDYVAQFDNVKCLLGNDMALSIDLSWYGLWVAANWSRLHEDSSEVLYAFRDDVESAGAYELPAGVRNIDLSVVGEGAFGGIASMMVQCASFLTAIGGYGRVVTDRLHVAIAASLLGKTVDLHDNSYGKCSAVFELSLRRRFPRTRLVSHS
jgi:exopolysaccharide biosynthesis predicted pyruvyltransferase EpsI